MDERGPRTTATFLFHEPTGGGGGLVEIDGNQVQLTLPQFELLAILAHRMEADRGAAASIRGFIDAATLLDHLSLDSTDPAAGHVRQLVRRVRRILGKLGLADLIESRRGLGYRLGVVPRIPR